MSTLWVLGGGNSPEREVSLRSSAAVIQALKDAGYRPKFCDPQEDNIIALASSNDIVLPILHGSGGEDGTLQALLESRGIPFLGADSKSSQACFDKWKTRQMLTAAEVPMPAASFIRADEYLNHPLSDKPHVLKRIDGGSSIGTYMFRSGKANSSMITEIFNREKLLLEELIVGVEITVPILDAQALPVIEIQPPTEGEFDYENKYNGATKELCPPENVSVSAQEACQQLALNVHRIMDCRHLSRVDIMLDAQNKPYVLEINTIPGMTDQSLLPKSAAAAGITMPALADRFIQMVRRDYAIPS
jgi:D-alanine-D-alanine ligase